MATAIVEAPVDDGGRWHGLFMPLPDPCPTHRCWTNECPAGSHDNDKQEA